MYPQNRQRATSKSFATRLPELRTIRDTALRDVLPLALEDIRREYALNLEEETVEWVEEWLSDLGHLFRLYKKQDWDMDAVLKTIRTSIPWRVLYLSNQPSPSTCPFLRFVPHPLLSTSSSPSSTDLDPSLSTQPILLLSLKQLTVFANDSSLTNHEKVQKVKALLVQMYELARIYLRDLDLRLQPRRPSDKGKEREIDESEMDGDLDRMRIVQFVLMVDVQGAGMLPNIGSEVASWVSNDLSPNYPGFCASVYIVNYSWAYSAMWAVVKRILPEKVLGRISFPSKSELLEQFPSECLPKDYGGSIPSFSPETDQVVTCYASKIGPPKADGSLSSTSTIVPSDDNVHVTGPSTPRSASPFLAELPLSTFLSTPDLPQPTYLGPTSPANPFYGYPAIIRHFYLPDGTIANPSPELLHGRRRKRDLIRTLFSLLILRWKNRFGNWMYLLFRSLRNLQTALIKRLYMSKTIVRISGFPPLLDRRYLILALTTALLIGVKRFGRLRKGNRPVQLLTVRDTFAMVLGGTASLLIPSLSLAPPFSGVF